MTDFIKTPKASFSFPLFSPVPKPQWFSSRYWMATNSRDRRLKNMTPLSTERGWGGENPHQPSLLPPYLRVPKLPIPSLTQDGHGKAPKRLVVCHLSIE